MSEEINKKLENLNIKQDSTQAEQQQQAEEVKSQEQIAPEVKKKKVIKSVRFNLETKRAAIAEKTAKDIQEILPPVVGESKGLFPQTLPNNQQAQAGDKNNHDEHDQPTLDQAYTDEEMNEMEQIKKWLFTNLKRDVDNAKAKGANPVELKVKNFQLIRKDDTELWNRVEFETMLDFTTIEQILISPEEPHPTQPTLKYATIVLFGKNKHIPLVFPYCYQKQNLEDFEQEIVDSKNKKEKKKLKKKLKKKMGNFTPNELDNWILVNSVLKEAYHKINEFKEL